MSVDELAGLPLGARLKAIRERKHKSRSVVAGLVGKSESWLKKVESGELLEPRTAMLVRLAEALELHDLAELTGDKGLTISVGGRTGHHAVPAMRHAIEAPILVVGSDPLPDASVLTARVVDAWALWHSSPTPRAAVGAVLPRIITDGRRATRMLEGLERRQAYAALSSAYALSEQLLAWVADSALLWLAADRCMNSAEQADDPLALASAAWVVGNVWRSTGREDEALTLAHESADLLSAQLEESEEARALWGAVRLHGAITAARMGREGDALNLMDQAASMVRRLPGSYAHPSTLFGAANAALTGVSVHVELRKGGRAVETAEDADPDSVPSLDRRARVWLEVARGYRQRKDTTAALHVLHRAVTTSRESMSCHPLARTLAVDLATNGGKIVQREARALAGALGVDL
ncbi:transcriptional regulator with XRE-family HTH domain [Actinokineospora baliensis]|uniref:helix-turn-helix domain-containing protein n=1 Tax=Actinokineospora baliensis TaxID=547056 RepID=UPI001956B544|nr:helix-turn-helix transcriptional regulator [Actinokineospora baliensis]MBM7771928.1 transcriptional regulator with XRE-family HTH domain [Actinokineospora baliensis]